MICVECTNPDIKCLYSKFKSKYIKLTVCPECGKLADKYIEFDNVLLFLDVLLLKPQAYRHVAYNLVEKAIFGQVETEFEPASPPKYRRITRYFVLSILFEVYLKWAYEEKSKYHSTMMTMILSKSDLWQYVFFIALLVLERVTLCGLLFGLFWKVLQWGHVPNRNLPDNYQRLYYACVLILAVFMSLIVKCLPIIMLIWPYDNATIASAVVDVVGVFTTVEALKMITNASYITTAAIVAAATVALIAMKQLVMSFVMASLVEGFTWTCLFQDEYQRILAELDLLHDFTRAFLLNLYCL